MSPAHDTLAATSCLQSLSRISFRCYLPRPGFLPQGERGEGEGRLNGKPLPSTRGLPHHFPLLTCRRVGSQENKKSRDFNSTAHPHTRIVGLTRSEILCFSCAHPSGVSASSTCYAQYLPTSLSGGCNHWQLGALPLALPPPPLSRSLCCDGVRVYAGVGVLGFGFDRSAISPVVGPLAWCSVSAGNSTSGVFLFTRSGPSPVARRYRKRNLDDHPRVALRER